MKKFDAVVIGGGPGGYVAAIRLAQLSKSVALIEADKLGGICLNWGCIPTKALLKSAEVYHLIKHSSEYGITTSDVKFDIAKVIERSRAVSQKLSSGIEFLMKKNKITVINAFGYIRNQNSVEAKYADGKVEEIATDNIIIATGARARVFDSFKPDGEVILTYKEAMVQKSIPKELLVIGSGAIGMEFASFYANFGSNVTIIEAAENILPLEDVEISAIARKSFEKDGIKIHTKAAVKSVKVESGKAIAEVAINSETKKMVFDKVISAVGVVPNTQNIGLENVKITVENGGFIPTDKYTQTSCKNIYAIGDVASAPWLAHKASHEGVIAAEKIAEKKDIHAIKKENIPACTYTRPQIASIGLTEKAAIEKGYEVRVGRFGYGGNGKAIAIGEPDGMVKTIFDKKTGELLGAHIIGAEATEMINGYIVGKEMEACEKDFMNSIFPHPTLSEMMHESVLDAFSAAIHK